MRMRPSTKWPDLFPCRHLVGALVLHGGNTLRVPARSTHARVFPRPLIWREGIDFLNHSLRALTSVSSRPESAHSVLLRGSWRDHSPGGQPLLTSDGRPSRSTASARSNDRHGLPSVSASSDQPATQTQLVEPPTAVRVRTASFTFCPVPGQNARLPGSHMQPTHESSSRASKGRAPLGHMPLARDLPASSTR